MREDVQVVAPYAGQHLLANLDRVHADLVDVGETAHEIRVDRRHVLRQVFRAHLVALMDRAVDEAWAQHRDADIVRRQVPAQAFAQAAHGEFRRGVDAGGRPGDEGRHRGGVDDLAALAMALHARHEGAHAVDDAAEIDAHHPIPVLEGAFVHRREQVDAGIVADDVDMPEDALRLIGGASHRVAVSHVDMDRMDAQIGV